MAVIECKTLSDLPKGTHGHIIGATPEQAQAELERRGVSGVLWWYGNGRGFFVIMFEKEAK